MKKITIDSKVINEIKDFGTQAFKNELDLSRFDTKELQVYLILQGLSSVLYKNGLEPGFEFPFKWPEDSESIEGYEDQD